MSEIKIEQPIRGTLPISVGAASETGRREQNQDSMTGFSSPFGAVYLIADGMGGHRGGAEASRMVVEAFQRHLLAAPASTPPQDAVTLAVRLANVEVLEKSKSGNSELAGMGSTVVIALVRQSDAGLELMTAHVGDSRAYMQRGGNLNLLTKDHTQVQWLLDTHAIDEAAARNHPDGSILTRAMGHTTDLQVDISGPILLQDGDGILLCSDGLSGFASSEDIDRTIRQNPDTTTCANQLVQLALASGSNDNITVQLLRIGNATPVPAAPRRRKTLLEGEALPAPVPAPVVSAIPPQKKGFPFPLLVLIVILIAAGVFLWWYRFHRAGQREDAIVKLGADLNQFGRDVKALKEQSGKDSQAVLDDIDKLDKSEQAKSLQKKFETLGKDIQRVAEKSDNFQNLIFTKYQPSFDKIGGEKPSPERQKDVSDLGTDLNASMKALHDDQKDLTGYERKLSEQEKNAGSHLKSGARANSPASPGHPANAGNASGDR
jgi:serine/threonine protein phosphatase PrpC